jgi:O-antigen/teichoic acid export membrane protein
MKLSTVGKNACFYAASTVGIRAASFLLTPVYTYSLTVHDYGLLAVLLQTSQIMVMVMSLGSRTALVRFAKEYEQNGRIDVLLGTSIAVVLSGSAIITLLSSVVLLPVFRSVLHQQNVLPYLLLTCAASAFNCLAFHIMGYYRAGHEGLKVTIASLSGAAGLIVLSTIFLRVIGLGIHGALLAQAVVYGLLAAFLLAMVYAKTGLRFSAALAAELIRFGLPLIPVMIGGLITQASAFYFLSYFRGLEDVGIYSLGLKMAFIVDMALILPFEMAYEPFVYENMGDPRVWQAIARLLTYLMAACAFVACGVAFASRGVLPLIAPHAFSPALFVIFLVLPAVAFKGVYYIGESLLYMERRTDVAGTITTIFTLFGVGLNYLLIPRWGMYGAIAVQAFTLAGIGVVALKLGLKLRPVRLEAGRLCVAAVLLFGFLAMVYTLRDANAYVYYSLIPAVVCAGTVALFAGGFVREDERRVIQTFVGRTGRLKSVFGV